MASENKLMEYVDLGGRAKEKPISYIPFEIFQNSLNSQANNFIEFLQNRFSPEIVKKTIESIKIPFPSP